MKLLLTVIVSEFESLRIELQDTRISYYGSIEGYDHDSHKSYCSLYFRVKDEETATEIQRMLSGKFKLNKLLESRYFGILGFEDHNDKKDKRPKIWIKFRNGSKGFSEGPEILVEPIKEES